MAEQTSDVTPGRLRPRHVGVRGSGPLIAGSSDAESEGESTSGPLRAQETRRLIAGSSDSTGDPES